MIILVDEIWSLFGVDIVGVLRLLNPTPLNP